ncbi:related to DUF895 domain membrane protein [Cephalotrichum gorgonifer]|uniref:Related to DUF895 domain membrane protein n=1 Tax=Cephalotrichum gorgonifer TaxID=2041049 RepID=A0AAE8SXS3_9PEZI|nr:related to DUF895 domain membrane protein [Cephalotrichum gorgonifer]
MEENKSAPSPTPQEELHYADGPIPRPNGWMYKGIRIFGHETWYASPKVQLLMVSFVCFLCPGMFNALGGMGGMGLTDPSAAAKANTVLYAIFAAVAFVAGTIANVIGLRITLAIGGLGYTVYIAAFFSYAHNQNVPFVYFAGAFLGLCAGLLWTAQGAIMMSYPEEENKGRYISWFWMIFNFGAVIGSLIPLGQNVQNIDANVNDGTYSAFLILTFIGAMMSLVLVNAKAVVRRDGSKVILMKNPTWKSEFKGLWECVKLDPWVIALFPMFFSSNTFYPYQQNEFNGLYFSTRTRALNSVLYWLAQIIGALLFGYAMDFTKIRRSVRAKAAYVAIVVLTFGIWGGGWAAQKVEPDRAHAGENAEHLHDWADGKSFIGPMFMYFFYGFFDAVYQIAIYWFMGSLSNSGRKTANYAGLYKAFQSAGAAVFWDLDARATPINTMFGATWGLIAFGIVCAFPVIWFRIQDTVSVEEDLKFSDETIEDVTVTGVVDTKGADHV